MDTASDVLADVLADLPWGPGAGIELLDGRVLTFEPHRDCPCADCRAAHRFGRFEGANDGE